MSDQTADKTQQENQANPAQGSAPATNNAPVTGQTVDSAPGQTENHSKTPPKGVEVEFFKLREAKRTLKSENEGLSAKNRELEARLAALESRNVSRPEVGSAIPNPIDDPEGYRRVVAQEAAMLARQAVVEDQAQARQTAEAVKAGEWLRTRSHVAQDPALAQEIAYKLNTKYAEEADRFPSAAAKAAYLEVCEEKGIEPDLGRNRPDPNRVVSPRPSSVGSSNSGEVSLDQMKSMNPVERAEAVKSGRYKGSVIRI